MFGAFDCPDASLSVPRRSRSTTPLQALNLFNSRFSVQQAGLLSERIQTSHPSAIDRQVVLAFRSTLQREPRPDELVSGIELAKEFGLEAVCRALLNCSEFLFVP